MSPIGRKIVPRAFNRIQTIILVASARVKQQCYKERWSSDAVNGLESLIRMHVYLVYK